MTALLITIDTELSAALHQRGFGLEQNLRQSIWGETAAGAFGIGWQMDLMDRHGLKGVFFLDPLPALIHGPTFLQPIVAAIVGRGHEVQLHLHSEWLAWVEDSPIEGRQGRNIGDFSLADQITLLGLGRDLLEQAGAPRISAFRAGNFGANDDTLRALAAIGIGWDSSVNPAFRPAQICAMSAAEMRAGMRHAALEGHDAFVIVTHSFEMLSRDRMRPNRTVMRRFEQLCRTVGATRGMRPAGFHDLSPALADGPARTLTRVPPSRLRTGLRIAQQAWATWRYEHRLVPA